MSNAPLHVWYYQKSTLLNVVDEGPFSEEQLLQLAKDKTLSLDTPLRSPTRTRNQWIMAERVPAVAIAINQAVLDEKQSRQKEKNERKARAEEAKLAKEKAKVDRIVEKASRPARTVSHKITVIAGAAVITLLIVIGGVIMAMRLSGPLSSEAIVKRSEKAIARVRGAWGQGSGFMATPRLLVTNRHVVAFELADEFNVLFPAIDKEKKVAGRVIYDDPKLDISIVELDQDQAFLRLAKSESFSSGAEITVIGSPGMGSDLVLENAVSRGVISTKATIEGNEYYQLSISVNPGNSGGPVFDSTGQVIGLLTLKAPDKDGIAFCIPIKEVSKALEKSRQLTDDEKSAQSHAHNAKACFAQITDMSRAHLLGMATYVDSINTALGAGRDINAGIYSAKAEVDELVNVFSPEALAKLDKTVSDVVRSGAVPDSQCQKLIDAATTLQEIRGYVTEPKGNAITYRAKYQELSDRQLGHLRALGLMFGE